MTTRRVVFLDRDGVLLPDRGVVASPPPPYPDAAASLARLNAQGWTLVVVTNQTAVARGLISEADLNRCHEELRELLLEQGAEIEEFLYCPHHPNATLPEYRCICDCRKPRPGLIQDAALRLGVDLSRSVMVGDRMTDVEAGWRAGCTTVLVKTGKHNEPRIVTADPEQSVEPDAEAPSLAAAVTWILKHRS